MTTLTHTVKASKTSRITSIISRTFLGLIFLVFGLNGFFHFIPMQPVEGATASFLGGLAQSGYFFPMLKSIEVLIGILLLANLFVPLVLVMLVPINLNILMFHLFLGPEGTPMSILLIAINLWMGWQYREYYRTMLTRRVTL